MSTTGLTVPALRPGAFLHAQTINIVMSEINYHPPVSDDDQSIESCNTSKDFIGISGWSFHGVIPPASEPSFTFHGHTAIGPQTVRITLYDCRAGSVWLLLSIQYGLSLQGCES